MRTDKSKKLFARAAQLLPGGVDSPVRAFKSVGGSPLFIARATGATLVDVDGNKYIDYVMSWGPLIHGHAPKGLTQAIARAGSGALTFGTPDSPGVTKGASADTLVASYNDIHSVHALFAANKDHIAAVIVEPIAGNMGVVPPAEGFLKALREACTANDALLIFDEV